MQYNQENNKVQGRPLKRVWVAEEYVALTGDFWKALILNQFLLYSRQTNNYDKLLQEEIDRDLDSGQPRQGWFYKSLKELKEETFAPISTDTLKRHIDFLVEKGWVFTRKNPHQKWDKTLQYRVNILKIQIDLCLLGFPMDGYPILFNCQASESQKTPITLIASSKTVDAAAIPDKNSQIGECSSSSVTNVPSEELGLTHAGNETSSTSTKPLSPQMHYEQQRNHGQSHDAARKKTITYAVDDIYESFRGWDGCRSVGNPYPVFRRGYVRALTLARDDFDRAHDFSQWAWRVMGRIPLPPDGAREGRALERYHQSWLFGQSDRLRCSRWEALWREWMEQQRKEDVPTGLPDWLKEALHEKST